MESITKQVEFYFSDANLAKDKFMNKQVTADPNGFVSIDTIAKFKRVQMLSTDLATVVESLKNSDKLQLNEDETKVARKTPFTNYENANKTIRFEGLPKEATLDELLKFFNDIAPAVCVRRQTEKATKEFIGTAWVDFEKEDDAKRVLEMPEVKYGDNVLSMKLKAEIKKEKAGKEEEKEVEEEEEEVVFPTGHLLLVKAKEQLKAKPLEMKKFFNEHTKTVFIEEKSPLELVVRFESPVATEIKEKLGSPVTILEDADLELEVIEGDEEVEQWKKIYQDKKVAGNKRGRHDQKSNKKSKFRKTK